MIVTRKKTDKKKMRHLAGSLEGVFEKIQQLNNISAAIEAHKMCLGGGGYQTDEAAFNFL